MRRQAYSISGKWTVRAPLDVTWNALIDSRTWRQWCPYVKEAKQLEAPNLMAIRWRFLPGVTLHIVLDNEDYSERENLRYKFSGDIVGRGEVWLRPKNKQVTVVSYGCDVSTIKPWMNMAPSWLRKLFRYVFERSLSRTEKSLNKYLAEK